MSITLGIVTITVVISLLCFNNAALFNAFKHYPVAEFQKKQYYRWVSSGFVHGDFIHLFINMFVFHEFGRYVEADFIQHFGVVTGSVIFLTVYILTIVMGDIPTYFKHQRNPYFSSVGASGGVSGIVFIFILLDPWSMLGLFFIIPIPAIIFSILYLWYSTWASKNQEGHIDHEAHFYGAIAGVILAVLSRPSIVGEFISRLMQDFPWY